MKTSRTNSIVRSALRPWVQAARYSAYRLRPSASYAADLEDLAASALLGSVDSFLDVGANDGRTCSNTLLFALRGASGVCFEPDPDNFRRLSAFYRLNRRVRCLEAGLSDHERSAAMRCDGLLSSVDGKIDSGLEALLADSLDSRASVAEVRLTTMQAFFDQTTIAMPVDLLSVDVEGHELNVLRGNDWRRYSFPARCVIVETHAVGTDRSWRHQDFDAIASLLESNHYFRVCASGNNTFWVHRSALDEERLATARSLVPHYDWRES